MQKKKPKTEICPVCKAKNSMFLYMGGHLGILYKCKKCGYVGPIIIEKHENNK